MCVNVLAFLDGFLEDFQGAGRVPDQVQGLEWVQEVIRGISEV